MPKHNRHFGNSRTRGFPASQDWLQFLMVVFTATTLIGCSTTPGGQVVMKLYDGVAHVSIESGSVDQGDIIALVESRCPRGPVPITTRKPSSDNCTKTVWGTGVVTEILSEEYASVEFPKDLAFEEGDAVEPYDHVRGSKR